MTTEHLRLLLDSQRDMYLFHEVCQQLARVEVSQPIVDATTLGRIEARRLEHRTYPELSGSQGRARVVVLAAEVGGRWSEEARSFVSQLARAKVRSLPRVLRGLRVRLGSIGGMLSCLAPPHERLPCPCWIVVQPWGVMATHPRSLTLLPLAATCLTYRESGPV